MNTNLQGDSEMATSFSSVRKTLKGFLMDLPWNEWKQKNSHAVKNIVNDLSLHLNHS